MINFVKFQTFDPFTIFHILLPGGVESEIYRIRRNCKLVLRVWIGDGK